MNDELRERLARLDPQPASASTDDAGSPRMRALLEEIMTTTIDDQPSTAAPRRQRRRLVLLVSAAAAVAAIAITAVAVSGGDSKHSTTLALTGASPRPGQSCIQFSVEQLATATDAFRGTVEAVTDTTATLKVTQWYKASGDKADTVTIENSNGPTELGATFEKGQDYLVAANGTQVDGCGFSGPATPDMVANYAAAFPG